MCPADFDVISFLERKELTRKLFFPTSYWLEDVYPVEIDESCTLFCKYIEVPNAVKTVILFYGNGESADYYGESKLVADLTTRFHCSCLIAEYRGYGRSTGKLTLPNVLSDVRPLISHLNLEEDKIVLFGRSMGGFPLIEGLSHFPNVAGVIMESTYSALSSCIKKREKLSPEQLEALDAYFSFPEKIKDFHHPVLLIHAIEDDLVPYYHCDMLKELFEKQSSKVTTFTALGSHNNIFSRNTTKYLKHVGDFLKSLK